MSRKVNWSLVDWSHSNRAIADTFGVQISTVCQARRKRRMPIVICSECKRVVDEETLGEPNNTKKLCRDCYCGSGCKPQPKLWTNSMISQF